MCPQELQTTRDFFGFHREETEIRSQNAPVDNSGKRDVPKSKTEGS